jgi:tRNA threonylcarbamoyladenosine biosynthesis protein TsaE
MTRLAAATSSADETFDLAVAVGSLLVPGDLVLLAGDLGTGKTIFAKGLARAVGVTEPVVSPTFTIVREYEGRVPLVHVDVYRLDHLQELHDLGFEELVDDSAVTLVEWGDVVAAVLPRERLEVWIEATDDEHERLVTLHPHGPSWIQREAALAALAERYRPGASKAV